MRAAVPGGAGARTIGGPARGSQIFGNATLSHAAIAELAPLAGAGGVPAHGDAERDGAGCGNARQSAASMPTSRSLRGTLDDEPFDRFSGRLHYNRARVEMTAGQLAAGAKQVRMTAAYDALR